jgi:hypothetical protein
MIENQYILEPIMLALVIPHAEQPTKINHSLLHDGLGDEGIRCDHQI